MTYIFILSCTTTVITECCTMSNTCDCYYVQWHAGDEIASGTEGWNGAPFCGYL